MFSGLTQQSNANAGKKIYGLPSRRDQEFTIGWTGNNNLNQFQMRKSKNKQVTGKITTQSIIHGQQTPYSQKKQSYVPPSRDYERMFYENPNMSNQELEKLMYQYEEYRGGPSKQSSKKETRLSEYSEPERRSAVRPKESMKDIIYNGVGAGQDISNRVGSRVQYKI